MPVDPDPDYPRAESHRHPDQLTDREAADWMDHNPAVEATAILFRACTEALPLRAYEILALCDAIRRPPTSRNERHEFAALVDGIMMRWTSREGRDSEGATERIPTRGPSRLSRGAHTLAGSTSFSQQGPASLSSTPGRREPGPAGQGPHIVAMEELHLCQECNLGCPACPKEEGINQ